MMAKMRLVRVTQSGGDGEIVIEATDNLAAGASTAEVDYR